MDFYPSMRYHRDGRVCRVVDSQEAAALGPEWADTPAAWERQEAETVLVPFVQTETDPHTTGTVVTVTPTDPVEWLTVDAMRPEPVKVRKGWPKGKPRKPKNEVSTDGHRADDHS